jgi:hypothetical protein
MKEGLIDASLSASTICRTWLPGDVFFWIFETIRFFPFFPRRPSIFCHAASVIVEVLNTVVVVAVVAVAATRGLHNAPFSCGSTSRELYPLILNSDNIPTFVFAPAQRPEF